MPDYLSPILRNLSQMQLIGEQGANIQNINARTQLINRQIQNEDALRQSLAQMNQAEERQNNPIPTPGEMSDIQGVQGADAIVQGYKSEMTQSRSADSRRPRASCATASFGAS